MGLATEAEKRRYFGPETLISEYIPTGQNGVERKLDLHEAHMLQPREKR